jgi:alpha-L-fucosidase
VWQEANRHYASERKQFLDKLDAANRDGKFQPNWNSLTTYQTPDGWRDLKFGIFIHWGVNSVPAFGNEWYPRNMYKQDTKEFKHHIETYGPQNKFGYKDFLPQFCAEQFDAGAWASCFARPGRSM